MVGSVEPSAEGDGLGTWITHLRLAERLLESFPDLDETAFAFGNLAPDSGLPNKDRTEFLPPKQITHFLGPNGGWQGARDLDFYRQHLRGLAVNDDRKRYSFLLGYFAHLVCDHLWVVRLNPCFKRDHRKFYQLDRATFWRKMKEDWYDLDFRYLGMSEATLFHRVFLPAELPQLPHLPFIPLASMRQQMQFIRKFYTAPSSHVVERTYPYLNEPNLSRFISDTAGAIDHIVDILSASEVPAGLGSSLQLLPADLIAPYRFPLGDPVAALDEPTPESAARAREP
ncbi:MAG: zinc dependent phospholipase C family protein [Trueperaceae bacterium]